MPERDTSFSFVLICFPAMTLFRQSWSFSAESGDGINANVTFKTRNKLRGGRQTERVLLRQMQSKTMMAQIFDLTEESIKRLRKLISDESVQNAADQALAQPSRRCKDRPASVHRLVLTDEQRLGILARLRLLLAREGFEEGGTMLPIGHIYEGLIETFSKDSRVIA